MGLGVQVGHKLPATSQALEMGDELPFLFQTCPLKVLVWAHCRPPATLSPIALGRLHRARALMEGLLVKGGDLEMARLGLGQCSRAIFITLH